ncbi:RluA family pseudouridine synthase [Candidatus Saccharibacteria bacterium]|nr:RluA family pseudouridine synthase [Candidatus Saccharibacteria bacterium]
MIRTGKKFSKPEMSRVINGDIILDAGPDKPELFRLDHLLVEQNKEYNRSTLQTFIKSGFVEVDGKIVKKPNTKVEKNAKIVLNAPKNTKKLEKLEVIFEDENVLVVDKPAGLLSMAKGEYCPETTLEDYGLLVHRLDRDTSGVVILAKNEETRKMLRKQFQDRKTHKTYYAIVEGRPKLDEAMIDLPIARNLKHPTTFQVDPKGKEAKTHYKVLKTDNNFSLIELKPESGRTHQLRVHMKYIGTPIYGDPVYGSGKKAKRLFLHAKKLEITIPGKNENQRKTFESELPKEFKNVF